MRQRQSSWILKQESPSPSASSLRRTVTAPARSRRSRLQPPPRRTRRWTSICLICTGLGVRKVVVRVTTLLTPLLLPARTNATPKRRSASSGSARTTTATASAPESIVRSTLFTRSSRSNSLGIANTHLFPMQSFPWRAVAAPAAPQTRRFFHCFLGPSGWSSRQNVERVETHISASAQSRTKEFAVAGVFLFACVEWHTKPPETFDVKF